MHCVGRYSLGDVQLGVGRYSRTEAASHQITRSKVVIKIADYQSESYKKGVQSLHHVAKILSQIRHPNIIKMYEVLQLEGKYYAIVLELAGGGSLQNYVRMNGGYLSEKAARPWVYQLLSALHHLHDRGIIHRNLHPANILMDDKRRRLKLSDFACAYNCNHETSKHCKPVRIHSYNNAPELEGKNSAYHPTSLDVWSLGSIIFFMLIGTCPFPDKYGEDLKNGLLAASCDEWRNLSAECQDMLGRMLQYHWDQRAYLLEIETHEWMTKNGDTFYPYTSPPRNHVLRNVVLQKLSRLLRMEYKQLQARVHEYRVDELSAMANLMMDDYLAMKEDSDILAKENEMNQSKCTLANDAKYNQSNIPESSQSCKRILLHTSSLVQDLGMCGGVHSGVHSVKGQKVRVKKDDKHSECCTAQYGNTYKLQPKLNELTKKTSIENLIGEKTLNGTKSWQISRKRINRSRPLGNATSYNMAVARSLFEAKTKSGSPIVESTKVSTPEYLMDAAINISSMINPESQHSNVGFEQPYQRKCTSAPNRYLSKEKFRKMKKGSSSKGMYSEKCQNQPRYQNNPSSSMLTVTVQVACHGDNVKLEQRPRTAYLSKDVYRQKNPKKDNYSRQGKHLYSSVQNSSCDKSYRRPKTSVHPHMQKIPEDRISSDITSSDEDLNIQDIEDGESLNGDTKAKFYVPLPRDMARDYLKTPKRASSSGPRIKSAVKKVPFSPSVVALDVNGIMNNWKIKPGVSVPHKQLVHAKKKQKGNKVKSAHQHSKISESCQKVKIPTTFKIYTDSQGSGIVDQAQLESCFISKPVKYRKPQTAWEFKSVKNSEVDIDENQTHIDLEYYKDHESDYQTLSPVPESTSYYKKELDQENHLKNTPPNLTIGKKESPYVKKHRTIECGDNSLKIQDLYRMLSQDLDNYLGRKVLQQSQPFFMNSTVLRPNKVLYGRKFPRSNNAKNAKVIKSNSKIYVGKSFENTKNQPSDHWKRSLRLKSAPVGSKQCQNTGLSRSRQSASSNVRVLGNAGSANTISTCTACDIQDLLPLSKVASAYTQALEQENSKHSYEDLYQRQNYDLLHV